MNQLKFTWESDDDGTGELFAEFQANGFSGIGSAWFDKINLVEESKKFEEYPITESSHPILEGGYWNEEKNAKLSQEHLHISVYPIDSRGNLGVRIRAATELLPEDRKESQHYVAVELKTTYEDIAKFAKNIRALVAGESNVATLYEAKV